MRTKSYLMWSAKIGILFLLKSNQKLRNLNWKILLILTFLPDFLMGIFVLFGIERNSLNLNENVLYFSQSLYTALILSIVSILVFISLNLKPRECFIYSIIPLISYSLNILAYPAVPILWNNEVVANGLYFYNIYNTNDVSYIAFIVELLFSIIAYLIYRYNNPLNDKKESAVGSVKNSVSKNPMVYSIFKGWTRIEDTIDHIDKSLEFSFTDLYIILSLAAINLPVLVRLFF